MKACESVIVTVVGRVASVMAVGAVMRMTSAMVRTMMVMSSRVVPVGAVVRA